MPTLKEHWRESLRLLHEDNDRAYGHLESVLGQYPADYVTLTNLAALCHNRGEDEKAEEYIARAMDSGGVSNSWVRYTLGLIQLKDGRWLEGWQNYEYRFRTGLVPQAAPYETLWHGERLRPGEVLTVWGEQGLGDQIQMARFLGLARTRSEGRVWLVCDPRLVKLLEPLADFATDTIPLLGKHIPMMSLPRVLGITPENLDGKSYIKRPEVPKHEGPLRVGVVWQSSAEADPILKDRSVGHGLLDALQDLPIEVHVLQYGTAGFRPKDFTETAAALAECDLVISVDTAVAHLAGAMGIPTWLLLRFQGDFRWLKRKLDSPWYDVFRLYRQPSLGNWGAVLQNVVRDLKELTRAR